MALHFKGRITFYELINSEMRYIQTFNHIMRAELATEEGKQEKATEQMQEQFEEMM